jgi:hypothetical protein
MEIKIGGREEVGRELKVSDLKTRSVVCLQKHAECPLATMWVIGVHEEFVHFAAQKGALNFIARRTGKDKQYIRDDDQDMKMFEYLGEI